MRAEVAHVLQRLQDPGSEDWFRERCASASAWHDKLSAVLSDAGFRVSRFKLKKPSPVFACTVELDVGELAAEHSVTFFGYVLANMFSLRHHVQVMNAAPEELRLDPFLDAEPHEPPTAEAARAVDVVTSTFAQWGWSRLSDDEDYEPALLGSTDLSIGAALSLDLRGWLGGEPHDPRLPPDIVPYRALVATTYADAAQIARGSRQRAPWERDLEQALLAAGRVQRLVPDNYPSAAWTVDFGEVTNGAFRARFLTDIYASKIAPVWFWTHRFIVDNKLPGATTAALEGWTVEEIGYTWPQQHALENVRRLLTAQHLTELAPWFVGYRVAPTDESSERRTLNEWLFRDPRGLADPAPRLEEEHPDRNVRARRGGLRE